MNETRSTLLEKIQTRGYWRVVIRPCAFVERRIENYIDLENIIRERAVELRGWDFPHVDSHTPFQREMDWIGQEIEWEHNLEIWRFYQSGQFIHLSGITNDWLDQSKLWRPYEGWTHGTEVPIIDSLYRFTEIFEFASRLALSDAGDERMRIEISVENIQNRILSADASGIILLRQVCRTSMPKYSYIKEFSRGELISEPRELALKPTVEFFQRFGWSPSSQLLRDSQARLRS